MPPLGSPGHSAPDGEEGKKPARPLTWRGVGAATCAWQDRPPLFPFGMSRWRPQQARGVRVGYGMLGADEEQVDF